jgi:hypothetical protein
MAHEAHRIAVATGSVWGELSAIRCQARCYGVHGDFKNCLQLIKEGKELVVQAGMQGGYAESDLMSIEAGTYLLKTEYAEAHQILTIILHHTQVSAMPVKYALTLAEIAFLDIVTGANMDIVSVNLDAARSLFQKSQYWKGISTCDLIHAELQLREGNKMVARAEYIRCFAHLLIRENFDPAWTCLLKLADPKYLLHSDSETTRWATVFLAFALCPVIMNRNMLIIYQALQCIGDVFARQHIEDTGTLSVFTIALDGFTWMDVHRNRAECMQTMGDLHLRRGDISKASTLWKQARPLFEQSQQADGVSQIDCRLAKIEGCHQTNLDRASKPASSV